MNPVLRAILIVMIMRAAEHFVDYLNHRARARHGGFIYELAILLPEPRDATPEERAGAAANYPSRVVLQSPAQKDDLLELCGLMFEIDSIIHAEGRHDRLLLSPITVDMVPLGQRIPGRLARAWARFSGYVEGLIGGIS